MLVSCKLCSGDLLLAICRKIRKGFPRIERQNHKQTMVIVIKQTSLNKLNTIDFARQENGFGN